MQQGIPHIKIIPAPYADPRYYHNVQTTIEHAARDPVCLTDESGNPVSDYAVSDLLADRNPQSVIRKVVLNYIHDQIPVCETLTVLINIVKLLIIL